MTGSKREALAVVRVKSGAVQIVNFPFILFIYSKAVMFWRDIVQSTHWTRNSLPANGPCFIFMRVIL